MSFRSKQYFTLNLLEIFYITFSVLLNITDVSFLSADKKQINECWSVLSICRLTRKCRRNPISIYTNKKILSIYQCRFKSICLLAVVLEVSEELRRIGFNPLSSFKLIFAKRRDTPRTKRISQIITLYKNRTCRKNTK